MHYTTYVERLVDLLDPAANVLLNATPDELAAAVASGDPDRLRAIDGQSPPSSGVTTSQCVLSSC